MAINDALKKLINTLGGTFTADDDTVSELLEQVDAAFESGEFVSSLPAVTAADNGDVLTVVAGEWSKAAIPAEIPAYTVADAGKVLTVNAEGALAWVLPE